MVEEALDQVEKWVNRNLMKFHKEKNKGPAPLGRNNLMYQ